MAWHLKSWLLDRLGALPSDAAPIVPVELNSFGFRQAAGSTLMPDVVGVSLTDHDLLIQAGETVSLNTAVREDWGSVAVDVIPDDAHRIVGLSIVNRGQILASTATMTTAITGIFYAEGSNYDGAVLENDGLIHVTAANGTPAATGVFVEGVSPQIYNTSHARIVVSGPAAVGLSINGPPIQDNVDAAVFENAGLIQVTGSDAGNGVVFGWGTWHLVNTGTIAVHAGQATEPFSFGPHATAISFLSNGCVVDNYGHINITADQDAKDATAILNAFVVVNHGDISGGTAIYELSNGDAMERIVHNYGTIEGLISMSDGPDRVTNAGAITGDIDLNEGNDRFDGTGGTVQGVIDGGTGNDTLIAGNGAETLRGGMGNDTIVAGPGTDTIDGGDGFDTAIFALNKSAYTITQSGGKTIVSGANGTATLTNVEHLQFADSSLAPSPGLTINVTWDASVANAPAGFKAAVNSVIAYFESKFSDPVSLDIEVGYGQVEGQTVDPHALAQSGAIVAPAGAPFTLGQLRDDARSAADSSAIASITADWQTLPLMFITNANAKAIGVPITDYGIDGVIDVNPAFSFDFNRSDGIAAASYDFFGVIAHELSEIMGRRLEAGVPDPQYGTGQYLFDLFHYKAAGQLATNGTTPGYFSIDGGNTNLDNFNTNASGDFGDWASSAGNDAFDAFARPGVVNAITTADLTALDVIGWDLATGNHTPAVVAHNVSGISGKAIPLTTLFSVSDPDGAADLSTVTVLYQTLLGGHLEHDGGPPDEQPAVIPVAELSQWSFVPGGYGSDYVTLYATDSHKASSAPEYATVTVGAGKMMFGTSAGDSISGTSGSDRIDASQGGNDIVAAGSGDDSIVLGATLDASDRIDGGSGFDQLVLDGDYSAGIVFTGAMLANMEAISLRPGHDYKLTLSDANVAPGVNFKLDAENLAPGDQLMFDASAVHHGSVSVFAQGLSNSVIHGSSGDDLIYADTVVFTGRLTDYAITYNPMIGQLTVRDLRAGSPDGTDTLTGTLAFQFSDRTVSAQPYRESAPVLGPNDDAIAYVEQAAPLALDPAITAIDSDDVDLKGATVAISGGFVTGDRLQLAAQPHIASSWNASTHTLMLSGTATVAEYQAALRAVTFFSSSDDPTSGGASDTRTIAFVASDGFYKSAPLTVTVGVIAVDDPPVLHNDSFNTVEGAAVGAGHNIFADNGAGADTDVDGPPLKIVAVAGSAANVGHVITLPSGAQVTVNADGTFFYNPNHAFDYLAAPSSGASDTVATDTFLVSVQGGYTEKVTIHLTGVDSNDTLQGTAANDTLQPGVGNDTVFAGSGDDTIDFGTNFTAADTVDGGGGSDTVLLNGDYTATHAVVLKTATLHSVETVKLHAGHSYSLTVNAATLAAGQTMTVDASGLASTDALSLNLAPAGSGHYIVRSGLGADSFREGASADTFVFAAASDSTTVRYDTISYFNYASDRIDIPTAVSAVDPAVVGGTLSTASFDTDLHNALAGHLFAHDAVLFTPNAGTLAGQHFLVVDLNGVAGYNPGADLVLNLASASGVLSTADFV